VQLGIDEAVKITGQRGPDTFKVTRERFAELADPAHLDAGVADSSN